MTFLLLCASAALAVATPAADRSDSVEILQAFRDLSNPGVVMDISDRVVVLDYGKKIGDGVPDEVKNNEDVIKAYLGAGH